MSRPEPWRLVVLGLACAARATEAATCDPRAALHDRAQREPRVAACYAARRVADAVTIDRAHLQRWPDDHDVRAELARFLVEVDDLDGAQVEYDRLVKARPRDIAIAKARADVLAWRGALDTAIPEYERLNRLAPNDTSIRLGLGLALRWAGRLEDAERTLASVAATNPEAAKALRDLHASPAWAAVQAERALRATPNDVHRWVAAIEAVMQADRLDDAQALADEARRRWPLHPRVLLAAWAVRDRRQDEATSRLAAARAAVARNPKDAAAVRDLARVLSWNGKYGESLRYYDRLVAAAPRDVVLRLERGRVRSWDGQLRAAKEDYPLAQGGEPGAAERGLAEVHAWSGNFPVAGRHWNTVQREAPDSTHAEEGRIFIRREQDRWLVEGGTAVYSDSDDFRAIRSDVTARKRVGLTTDVHAQVSDREYDQLGAGTRATRGRVGVQHWVNDHVQVRAAAGANVYHHGETTPSVEAAVDAWIDPESSVGVHYQHDDIVGDAQTGGSVMPDVIEGDRVQAYGAGVLPGRIEVRGLVQGSHYSDGNDMAAGFVGLYRRVWREPEVKVGVEGRYVTFADHARVVDLARTVQPTVCTADTCVNRYWDPQSYASGNAVVRVQKTIPGVGKVMLDGGLGYGNEEGNGVLESSAGARFELAEIGRFMLELFYRWGRTARTTTGRDGGGGYEFHTGGVTVRWRGEGQ